MKFRVVEGAHGLNDRIILVNPSPDEKVSIFDIARLVNLLAYNELEKDGGKARQLIADGLWVFLFKEAIVAAIEDAEAGYCWGDVHSFERIKQWAADHHVRVPYEISEVIDGRVD